MRASAEKRALITISQYARVFKFDSEFPLLRTYIHISSTNEIFPSEIEMVFPFAAGDESVSISKPISWEMKASFARRNTIVITTTTNYY